MNALEAACWREAQRVIRENKALDEPCGFFPLRLMWLMDADSAGASVRSSMKRIQVACRLYFDYALENHSSCMKADLLSGVLLVRHEKNIHAFYRLRQGGALMLTCEMKSIRAGYRVMPIQAERNGFLKDITHAVGPGGFSCYAVEGMEALLFFDHLIGQVDDLTRKWIS